MRLLEEKHTVLKEKMSTIAGLNERVQHEGVITSINRIYWSAPSMAIGSVLIAFIFSKKQEIPYSVEETWRNRIILAHTINAFLSLAIWFISSRLRNTKAKEKVQIAFLHIVVTYVFALGIMITLIDQSVTMGISPFLLTSTMVGFLYYLRPRVSAVFYLLNFVIFHIVIVNCAGKNIILLDSIISNGLLINALGFSLSILSWRAFRTNRLQQQQIELQRDTLAQMAYRDPLTHLPNRRLLDELIRRELHLVERGEVGSCLIVIDLDNFKVVNDNYGHPAGDAVLQQFAHLLQKNMRGSNTLVRLGGEEFVILSSDTTVDQALVLAERLRKLVEGYNFSADGKTIKITASFGVAPLFGTEDLDNYYTLADQALYRAKQQGKNQVAV